MYYNTERACELVAAKVTEEFLKRVTDTEWHRRKFILDPKPVGTDPLGEEYTEFALIVAPLEQEAIVDGRVSNTIPEYPHLDEEHYVRTTAVAVTAWIIACEETLERIARSKSDNPEAWTRIFYRILPEVVLIGGDESALYSRPEDVVTYPVQMRVYIRLGTHVMEAEDE